MQQTGEEAVMNGRERGEGGRRGERAGGEGRGEQRYGEGKEGGEWGVGGGEREGPETADCLGVCCRQRRQVSETITLMVLTLTSTMNISPFF